MAKTKDELAEILNEVALELAQDSLSKAEPSDESVDQAPAAPAAEAAAPAPAAPEAAPSGEPAEDTQLTPEQLMAEYAQLSPEELEMHKQALMGALAALEGAKAPAPEAPAEAPSMEKSGLPEMAKEESSMKEESSKKEESKETKKAEIKASKGNGGQITKKSEEALQELVTKQAELLKAQQEDLANMAKAMDALLDKPIAKGITSVAGLRKSEPELDREPTREDVIKMLNAKIPELSKKERDLVAKFNLGHVGVEALTSILGKL